MARRKKRSEHPLLHTVEEATELLRRCEPAAWAWWFAGSAPFSVGLLHFTSDMSRAASAAERLPGSALVLALLYWWMKVAQAMFSDHLMRQLRGETAPKPLTWKARLRLVTSQAVIHGTAPWMLILSFAAMLPFGWVYAAYHNVSVLAVGVFREGGRTRDLVRTALRQSSYRQGQNHGLLLLLLAFSGIVWLNWHSALLTAAMLGKAFTGDENAITRNPMMLLSTGVMTATLTASYLVVGPFVKALYALRCFYSLSRKNGEDIAVAFRGTTGTALIAVLILAVMPAQAKNAVDQSPAPAAHSQPSFRVDPKAFEQQVQKVMEQDIFQWRMPRESTPKDRQKTWFESFLEDVHRWLKNVGDSAGNAVEEWMKGLFKDWLKDMRGNMKHPAANASTAWADTAQMVLKVLLVVLAITLAVLIFRQWRKMPPAPVKGAEAAPEIDLEHENVVATQLPENEWLRLADEKINSGEFRLAMRALFLATLAHLGDRRLVMVVRSKSNGDYVRELGLRARDLSELRRRFADSVRVFDWAWYGWHDVNRELLEQFRDNHHHIISDGRTA